MHGITKKLVALAAVLLVSASLIPAMAQKVTLNYNNTRIDTVLGSIQRQTGLRMVYSDQTIDVSRKVTVNVTNSELTDVLDELLAGTGTVYEISDGKLYFKVSKPTGFRWSCHCLGKGYRRGWLSRGRRLCTGIRIEKQWRDHRC